MRATGYVSTTKDGKERLNFTAFYEALLEAKGMDIGRSQATKGPGRQVSGTTRVHFNGNLMVGKAYTALLDLKPGDAFQIQLGRRQIKLIPMEASHDPEDGSSLDPADQQEQQEQQLGQEQLPEEGAGQAIATPE